MEANMASLAQLDALGAAIMKEGKQIGPFTWLDPQLGLVAGTYPLPKARFDFATERFVEIESRNSVLKEGSSSVFKKRISLLGEAPKMGQNYEIETMDAIYRVGSATQLLIQGLNIIEDKYPGTHEKLSTRKKRSKRIVARDRSNLYDVPHPDSHSMKLKSGFYVATNNKATEALGFLRDAAETAGLQWGSSFVVRQT